MKLRHRFDVEKAVEALLYIAEQVPDTYTALKVLYFADKDHLSKYGRLICSDSYVAMLHGPVPSGTYDLIKYARGDGFFLLDVPIQEAFAVQGNDIIPCRKANLDFLSESDIECLDIAIEQYGRMSFGQLRQISHNEEAFKSVDRNDFISLEAIVKSLPDSEQLWDYIENN
jgi:uncharacterized phage-associated protein